MRRMRDLFDAIAPYAALMATLGPWTLSLCFCASVAACLAAKLGPGRCEAPIAAASLAGCAAASAQALAQPQFWFAATLAACPLAMLLAKRSARRRGSAGMRAILLDEEQGCQ